MPTKDDRPHSASTAATMNFRNRQAVAMTPEQRLERAEQLQVDAIRLVMASPEGYRAFLERNLRKRRTQATSEAPFPESSDSKNLPGPPQ